MRKLLGAHVRAQHYGVIAVLVSAVGSICALIIGVCLAGTSISRADPPKRPVPYVPTIIRSTSASSVTHQPTTAPPTSSHRRVSTSSAPSVTSSTHVSIPSTQVSTSAQITTTTHRSTATSSASVRSSSHQLSQTSGSGAGQRGSRSQDLGIGPGERDYINHLNPCKFTTHQLMNFGFPASMQPRPVAGAIDIDDHYHGVPGWIHTQYNPYMPIPMTADICNFNQTGSNNSTGNKNMWMGAMTYANTGEPVSLHDYPTVIDELVSEGLCNFRPQYSHITFHGYPAIIGKAYQDSPAGEPKLACYQIYVGGISFAIMGIAPFVTSAECNALENFAIAVLAEEKRAPRSSTSVRSR